MQIALDALEQGCGVTRVFYGSDHFTKKDIEDGVVQVNITSPAFKATNGKWEKVSLQKALETLMTRMSLWSFSYHPVKEFECDE